MMNLTVSSRRGMMMCSIELTRRFVDRITSSNTVNAVCNPKKRIEDRLATRLSRDYGRRRRR